MAAYTFNSNGVGIRAATALSLDAAVAGATYVWVNDSNHAVEVDYTLSAAATTVSFDNEVSIRDRAGANNYTAIFPANTGGVFTVTGATTTNFGVARPDAGTTEPVRARHMTSASNGTVFRIEATVA